MLRVSLEMHGHGVVHVMCPLKMLTSGGGLRSRGRMPA
jgi:hypothetical protein